MNVASVSSNTKTSSPSCCSLMDHLHWFNSSTFESRSKCAFETLFAALISSCKLPFVVENVSDVWKSCCPVTNIVLKYAFADHIQSYLADQRTQMLVDRGNQDESLIHDHS